jgi:hypothetical protein
VAPTAISTANATRWALTTISMRGQRFPPLLFADAFVPNSLVTLTFCYSPDPVHVHGFLVIDVDDLLIITDKNIR